MDFIVIIIITIINSIVIIIIIIIFIILTEFDDESFILAKMMNSFHDNAWTASGKSSWWLVDINDFYDTEICMYVCMNTLNMYYSYYRPLFLLF